MDEIWKDIEGYEGLYIVSNLGRVKGLTRNRILTPRPTNKGYYRVHLSKEGTLKDFPIHRLVAKAFLDNPNNYNEVSHLDETKTNNCVSNLAWVSHSENCKMPLYKERQLKAKINNPKKSKIVRCIETGIVYPSTMEAERQTGILHHHISNCCNKKQSTAGYLHWEFVEVIA